MRGSISCAVIFSSIDRAQLNNDRYQAQRNDDPLNQTKTYRDYVRRENLKIHQAKKGGSFHRGQLESQELNTILEQGRNKRGIVFEGIPVEVDIVRRSGRPTGSGAADIANLIALEDNKRSKRFDKVAVVFEDLGTGRYWLHSLI